MLLWTIQHIEAYEKLMQNGVLTANENYLFCEDDMKFAYDWISEQLKQRVGILSEEIKYPIWAWYQWEGMRKRPDMRVHRDYKTSGTPIYLLTIDVPEEQVLLSDFDMWHCVLNNSLCPLSEFDDMENPSQAEIEKSWENIFKWNVVTTYWNNPKSTQAIFWQLKAEWIIKAELFISR